MSVVRKIARPMLASVFVVSGLNALRHPGPLTTRARPFVSTVSGPLGIPDDPELLVRANGAAMLAGGGLLALGRIPRISSLALAATLVPTTLAGRAFWEDTDPTTRAQNRTQFLKNVGLLGGLLLASVDTEGRPGLAYRARMVGDSTRRTAESARKDARYAARTARREAKLRVAQAHDALR